MRLRVEQQRLCCSCGQRDSERKEIIIKMSPTWRNKVQVRCRGSRESRHACVIAARDLLASSRPVLHVNDISPVRRSEDHKCPGRPAGRLGWIRETCLRTVCLYRDFSSLKFQISYLSFLLWVPMCPLCYLPVATKRIHTEDQTWLMLARHLHF